ncbi:MmgE/PrpD family protein [Sphingobium sp.]|uniref:MmgE/PrpD family protein n=1 Tax=Sphingobium sp. TaxID=1912891 RepID=UPI00260F697C|nr:MmgE/PrpD family protein [Sphingobium sp.]
MTGKPALTQEIARYAVETRFDALPPAVRHEAARAWLNWVGVAIAGSRESAPALAARMVAAQGTGGKATIIGHGVRTDMASAAFVNCIASSVLAFDDAHLPSVAHPSGPAAAALFALAQSRSISGEELLNALALGIEVQCRLANMLVLPPGPVDTSYYVNGLSGPIGVAAAMGRLLGLDRQAMGWAIGIAASQGSGFRSTHGTMTAHFRPGHATRCGVTAALLAAEGFDCTDDALEADGGFFDVYARGSDPAIALADLGTHHEMLRNRYKPYPCGIVIHPVIDACQSIRAQAMAQASPIAQVRLLVNPLVLRLTGKREPRTMLESHVSVFHWASVALLQDRPGIAATQPDSLTDPHIARLRALITADPVPDMGKGEARVEAILADGSQVTAHVEHARGSIERPMTDNELDTKFMDLAEGQLGSQASALLRDACWRVATMDDVGAELGPLIP